MPDWTRAVIALLLAAGPLPSPAQGAPRAERGVSTLGQIGPALLACWRPPAASAGMEVTLRFSLKRTGEILGRPRVTYAKLHGTGGERERFVASVLDSFAECLPVPVTGSLGGAIAGRVFTMRYVSGGEGQGAGRFTAPPGSTSPTLLFE